MAYYQLDNRKDNPSCHHGICTSWLLFCLYGGLNINCMAQTPVTTVADSPTPLITFVPLLDKSSSSSTTFKGLDPIPAGNVAATFVVVSNNSHQAIVGLSGRWVFVGADGKTRSTRQRCDIYFSTTTVAQLAAPGSRVLFGPNTCVDEQLSVPNLSAIVSSREHLTSSKLTTVSEVRIAVDGVIFDDGSTFGSDGASFTAEINARVSAAHEIAQLVRAAFASGHPKSEIFSNLEVIARTKTGPDAIWFRNLSHSLLVAPSDASMMSSLASFERVRKPTIVLGQ